MPENIFFNPRDLKYCGKNTSIGEIVRIRKPEKVSIGDYSIIDDFTYISGEVEIGKYVHIAPGCTLSASKSKIVLGDFSAIASGTRVYAATSSFIEANLSLPTIPDKFNKGVFYKEVIIEKHALIGANCVILPGCHIPEGMATAAGIVVRNKKYQPWVLVVDSSGRHIKRKMVDKYLNDVNEFLYWQEKSSGD